MEEAGEAYLIQKSQRDKVEDVLIQLSGGLDELEDLNLSNNSELDRLLVEAMDLSEVMGIDVSTIDEEAAEKSNQLVMLSDEELESIESPYFDVIDTVDVNCDWKEYINNVQNYADKHGIDLKSDPYDQLLSQTEKNEIAQRIRDDYVMKKAECDKYDYIIAAFCGVICGLIDSFFVKMPSTEINSNSKLGQWTDRQADKFVESLSKNLWKADSKKRDAIKDLYKNKKISKAQRDEMLKKAGIPYNQNIEKGPETLQQCIQYLEKKYSVNYDATSAHYLNANGKLGSMNPGNHHLKSLGHAPSIVGLLFSIFDQFTGSASFADNGRIIHVIPKEKKNEIDQFELRGTTIPTKIICGFSNWLGHLCSDCVGASGTRAGDGKGRGSGLPAPMMEIFQLCHLSLPDGDGKKITISELTVKIFENGYDLRFAAAAAIPVVLNEFMIRLLWSLKSRFYHKKTWKESIPFGQHPELRRMLLVGHGVLCIVDAIDAGIRSVDLITFALHLNVVAWSRLAIAGLQEIRAIYKENTIDVNALDDDLEIEWRKLYKAVM